MKRSLLRWITLICALAAMAVLAISSSPYAGGAGVAGSNNAFAFALYAKLAEDGGNLFFSPYSLFSALAMTYAGARGETARQMAAALHLDLAGEDLHRAFAGLMEEDLGTGDGKNELMLANALWGQRGYPFRPEFLATIEKYYRGGFTEVDYVEKKNREEARQAINRWTEERTAGKIKELIKPNILTALTRLVLTNAVYFKGQWASRFDRAETKAMAFRLPGGKKAEVPMMRQRAKFNYAEDGRTQVLEMPYAGERFSMVIILPRDEDGLGALEKNLTAEWITVVLGRLKPVEIEVFLPRFKVESAFILNEKLKALGMVDAFDAAKADFTGMAPRRELYITHAVHKAYVEVDEEGTEAAAATGIVMGIKSMPLVFRADHPFLFFIRDRRSGCLLFLGRLVEPR
ncbi:MAG: serpin family protein [Firmicutes bacterium]|nr:serpin family protein [Bacillota bacterium]